MRAWVIALLLIAPAITGCASKAPTPAALVPYPRIGDIVTYDAAGALVELARWEMGAPLTGNPSQIRFALASSGPARDGARALVDSFRVTEEIADAGTFVKHSDTWIGSKQEAIVQSYHPLSQDQSIVAFDERGLPWLWGASLLFGEALAPDASFPLLIPDDLGKHDAINGTLRVDGMEGPLTRVAIELPGANGTLWMEPGSAWPARVQLTLTSDALAPHVRSNGGYPVTIDARRISIQAGSAAVPPRDRGASFGDDAQVQRVAWDGQEPPDGDITALNYTLADAVRDAKLLDKGVQDWLGSHDSPILYRGTYQEDLAPGNATPQAEWLLQWVDRSESYYEVQIARVLPPPLPAQAPTAIPGGLAQGIGAPRVEKSGPAEAPANKQHGWFPRDSVPDKLVPLSEGVRIVRDTFAAGPIQIFLRSFADPPGYSYFIDGGWEPGGVGRYTVVYNPNTGFIEEATGPVSPRVT